MLKINFVNPIDLKNIIEQHLLWLNDDEIGTRANLAGADLTDANIVRANLTGANLTGANLTGANLTQIQGDVASILDGNPDEVKDLMLALVTGNVDGSVYKGDCACLIGTIANIKAVDVDTMPQDGSRPAERWFLAIRTGDTHDNSQIVAITQKWIQEWLDSRNS